MAFAGTGVGGSRLPRGGGSLAAGGRPRAEMAGSTDDTQATSTAQEPDTGEDGPQILVLNYHKVSDEFLSLAVAPADFDWQMRYLKEHGYHAITPDELYDALEGTGQLPANPVLITFDDGYQDNYDNAYPILRKYGLKGTVFVVTSFLGTRKGYLTWDECREMEKNGMTVASHTVDHKSMTDLTNDQLRAELVESKKKAEAELGHEVKCAAPARRVPTTSTSPSSCARPATRPPLPSSTAASALKAASTPSARLSSTQRRRTATSSSVSITLRSSRVSAGRSTEHTGVCTKST